MGRTGRIKIPAGFRYREVFLKGKPQHDRQDPFRIRHPGMDRGKRAKIFAPFDALRGFGEAVAEKDVLYEDRIIPNQEEQAELNRRLVILRDLTQNRRAAEAGRLQVTVTYYEPCGDVNHEAYGRQGQYRTVAGVCRKVDAEETKTILIEDRAIPLEDVLKIEGSGDVF